MHDLRLALRQFRRVPGFVITIIVTLALGIGAFAGRVISMADDAGGAAPVGVLSYDVWRSDYNGGPSIVSSTFYIQTQVRFYDPGSILLAALVLSAAAALASFIPARRASSIDPMTALRIE